MNKKRKQKLHEIYNRVPKIECQGKCTDFCGALGMEAGERDEMVKASGEIPHVDRNLNCNYLKEGKCSVYKNRPLICRVWGVVENLRCPFGCKFERRLTLREMLQLYADVKKVAGNGRAVRNCNPENWAKDIELRAEILRKVKDNNV